MNNTAKTLLFTVSLLFAALAAAYHLKLVRHPFPTDSREGAMLMTTGMLLDGLNPYDSSSLPSSANIYGALYSASVYPAAKIFGNTTRVHKTVSAVFIAGSCALMFIAARFAGAPVVFSFAAAVSGYLSFIYGTTPLNRPDALGLFLFLAAVILPFMSDFSVGSMIVAAALSAAAFYAKNYFALGFVYPALYASAFRSKRSGLFAVFAFALVFAVSVLVVGAVCPNYFYAAFLANYNVTAQFSVSALIGQSLSYLKINSPLILMAGLYIAPTVARGFAAAKNEPVKILARVMPDFSGINKPLFGVPVQYFVFCALLSAAALVFKLGGWGGAWLSYYFQLFSPFLILSVFSRPAAARPGVAPFLFIFLVAGNMFSVFASFGGMKNAPAAAAQWKKIQSIVAESSAPLNHMVLAPMFLEMNLPVTDNGHTYYMLYAAYPPAGAIAGFFPRTAEIAALNDRFVAAAEKSALEKKYDLIILRASSTGWPVSRDIVEAGYKMFDSAVVCLPHMSDEWHLEFWRPAGGRSLKRKKIEHQP